MFKKNNPGCGCKIEVVNFDGSVCRGSATWNACVDVPNSVSIETSPGNVLEGLPNAGSMEVDGFGPYILKARDCVGTIQCTAPEILRCVGTTPGSSGAGSSGIRYTLSFLGNYNGIPSGLPSNVYSGTSIFSAFGLSGACTNPPNQSQPGTFDYNNYTLDYLDIVQTAGTYVFDGPFLTVANCKPFLTPITVPIFVTHVHVKWVYSWDSRHIVDWRLGFPPTSDVSIGTGTVTMNTEYDVYIDTIDGTPYLLPYVLRISNTNINYYLTGTLPSIGHTIPEMWFWNHPTPNTPCVVEVPSFDFDSDNDTVLDSWSKRESVVTSGALIPC